MAGNSNTYNRKGISVHKFIWVFSEGGDISDLNLYHNKAAVFHVLHSL